MTSLSAARINGILIVLFLMFPLVGMGIDLIAPSLPAITHSLGVTPQASKILIAIYLLGNCLGNVFSGFSSDSWGRRYLALSGLLGFTIFSIVPVMLPTLPVLFLARFFQGFCLAMASVLARTIMSDILVEKRLVQIIPMISTVWGIGPIIGPVIGGYLQYYFDWQACFYFFAAYGLILFVLFLSFLPETHHQRQPLHLKIAWGAVREMLSHRIFLGSILVMGWIYSLMIIFNTLGPFLVQVTFHHTPVYFGHAALCMGIAYLLGTIVCRQLLKVWKWEQVFLLGFGMSVSMTFLLLLLVWMFPQGLLLLVIFSTIIFFACGLIFPSVMSRGFVLFRHYAGKASAIINLLMVLS